MTVNIPELAFWEWLQVGWQHWLLVIALVMAGGLLVGWLVSALRNGPIAGLVVTGQVLAAGIIDLVHTSPRRVGALSWLAIKESIRGRILVVFAIFMLIPLFAGWYIDVGSTQPARLYLSVVLTVTSFLVVCLLAPLLSSLSLPTDIRNKTLHTVVTKPVRPGEIVLGRVIGFTVIGTVLLAAMGLVSYVCVVRGLSHTHELTEGDLSLVSGKGDAQSTAREGRTSRIHEHRHRVFIDSAGNARVEPEQGHWHELTIAESGGESVYTLGPPQELLVARVPLYGKLRFKDQSGKDTDRGINVGDEWTYRSFIEGGSLAAAIWSFDGITEDDFPADRFPNGLPLEMTIEVFRTTKGETEDPEGIPGLPGILSVQTKTDEIIQLEGELEAARRERDAYPLPDEGATPPQAAQRNRWQAEVDRIHAHLAALRAALPPPIEVKIFTAKDFTIDVQHIPRELTAPDGRKLDLFKDVAHNGQMEVWLRCASRAQYFGAAQADVYFRARDASFAMNLAKGYVGIWLQMLLVIAVGVMFSTFLSGPIALVATLGTLVGGYFGWFMRDLGAGKVLGGGPVESLIRLLTQQNVVSDMEPGLRTSVAKFLDRVQAFFLRGGASVLPDFGRFSLSDYVAYGYDISPDTLTRSALYALGFVLPVLVAGYFFLKTREVAR